MWDVWRGSVRCEIGQEGRCEGEVEVGVERLEGHFKMKDESMLQWVSMMPIA